MQKKFLEGWRAALHIGELVQSDFNGQGLKVYVERMGGEEAYACRGEELFETIAHICNQFPMAEVQYHPDSAYGFVAQILCSCQHETLRGCCRSKGCQRSRVLLLLQPSHEADTKEHKEAVLKVADENMEGSGTGL